MGRGLVIKEHAGKVGMKRAEEPRERRRPGRLLDAGKGSETDRTNCFPSLVDLIFVVNPFFRFSQTFFFFLDETYFALHLTT